MYVYLNNATNTRTLTVAFPLQGIMWPQVITGILANLVNALLNYIFIFPLDMGIQWVLPSLPCATFSRAPLALPHEIICCRLPCAEALPSPTRCPRPPCLCCCSCTLSAEVSIRPPGEVSSLLSSASSFIRCTRQSRCRWLVLEYWGGLRCCVELWCCRDLRVLEGVLKM